MKFWGGTVYNHSSKSLWVVADGVAHRLDPKRRSPYFVDADGAKTIDGTAIDGHSSWWKVRDFFVLHVFDDNSDKPTLGFFHWGSKVAEGEFGKLTYDNSDGWGHPIGF